MALKDKLAKNEKRMRDGNYSTKSEIQTALSVNMNEKDIVWSMKESEVIAQLRNQVNTLRAEAERKQILLDQQLKSTQSKESTLSDLQRKLRTLTSEQHDLNEQLQKEKNEKGLLKKNEEEMLKELGKLKELANNQSLCIQRLTPKAEMWDEAEEREQEAAAVMSAAETDVLQAKKEKDKAVKLSIKADTERDEAVKKYNFWYFFGYTAMIYTAVAILADVYVYRDSFFEMGRWFSAHKTRFDWLVALFSSNFNISRVAATLSVIISGTIILLIALFILLTVYRFKTKIPYIKNQLDIDKLHLTFALWLIALRLCIVWRPQITTALPTNLNILSVWLALVAIIFLATNIVEILLALQEENSDFE